jgi:hypothetical protein
LHCVTKRVEESQPLETKTRAQILWYSSPTLTAVATALVVGAVAASPSSSSSSSLGSVFACLSRGREQRWGTGGGWRKWARVVLPRARPRPAGVGCTCIPGFEQGSGVDHNAAHLTKWAALHYGHCALLQPSPVAVSTRFGATVETGVVGVVRSAVCTSLGEAGAGLFPPTPG